MLCNLVKFRQNSGKIKIHSGQVEHILLVFAATLIGFNFSKMYYSRIERSCSRVKKKRGAAHVLPEGLQVRELLGPPVLRERRADELRRVVLPQAREASEKEPCENACFTAKIHLSLRGTATGP